MIKRSIGPHGGSMVWTLRFLNRRQAVRWMPRKLQSVPGDWGHVGLRHQAKAIGKLKGWLRGRLRRHAKVRLRRKLHYGTAGST